MTPCQVLTDECRNSYLCVIESLCVCVWSAPHFLCPSRSENTPFLTQQTTCYFHFDATLLKAEATSLKNCSGGVNKKPKKSRLLSWARICLCLPLCLITVFAWCAPVFLYRPYFTVDHVFVRTPLTSQWAPCCLGGSSSPTLLSSSKLRLRLYAKFSGFMVTSRGASEGLRGSGWVNTLLLCSHDTSSSRNSWFSIWRWSRTYNTRAQRKYGDEVNRKSDFFCNGP